ncbi:hypothetical protein LMH87_011730 [Akanthomyces muscarius]|uniref:DUF7582 domain-containing protein n=1 Tax=Akanthomyces muscarius TaxID=2231603 RepID=A0A9W8UL27_AKAMU|nr:hypothetical protein LMH87_011730 [Akanthomyces muscarius]KAJ4151009.1 hypothetical protein LMH87_011730 [Akanthomyces muscarius]
MSLKDKISSPLEAGPSLLDAHHIPPQLGPALEYTSARLARKSLHLTLVVARRDYQLPPSPVLCSPSLGSYSPASPSSSSMSRFTRHLHLPRWGRHQTILSPTSATSSMPTSPRSAISSPSYTPMSLEFPQSQQQCGPLSPRSPMWPLTPMTPLSPPPMTPSTGLSSIPTEGSSYGFPMTPQHGVRLIHHGNLPPKAEKTLQSALAKAGRKAGGAATHIAPALSASACGFNKDLFNNSIAQNDVLFSSDGLSLISFDRLYSLKAALSSYSKTGSPLRLEDAVDELRRYVLASGEKVSKMHLLRSYDWLNVSHSALADLDRMYRRAYGGVEMQGGIDGMYFAPVPEASSVCSSDDDDENDVGEEHEYHDQDSGVYVEGLPDSPTIDVATVGMAVSSTTPVPAQQPKRSPSPKMPLLRVQTSFVKTPAHRHVEEQPDTTSDEPGEEDEGGGKPPEAAAEDDVVTARPDDEAGQAAAARNKLWRSTQSTSIAQVLSPGPDPPPRDQDGPMTPNGYDDISPITRGEWGFLLVDQGFQNARTVAVTTC